MSVLYIVPLTILALASAVMVAVMLFVGTSKLLALTSDDSENNE